jgi:hypothetical protein
VTSIDLPHSPVPRAGRTFRTAGSVRFGGACGIIGAVVLIILGASAHSAHAAAGRVVLYVGAGLMIVFSIRALSLGVHVTKDCVRIRNMLITRWIRLSDIERFSYGPLRVFPAVGIATRRNKGRDDQHRGGSRGSQASARERSIADRGVNQLLDEHRVRR